MVCFLWLSIVLGSVGTYYHLRDTQNYFVVLDALITILGVVAACALIVGVFGVTFISAMLSPFRWLERQTRATRRIINDIGTYIAKRRSWSLLQETAFGLEGYNFAIPPATREPTFAPSAIYKYEDLAQEAEQRAVLKREEWVKRAFGDVAKTLSQMATPDLETLMQIVETDLSLMHAAYYSDDECIERIAAWIAGRTAPVGTKLSAATPSSVVPETELTPRLPSEFGKLDKERA